MPDLKRNRVALFLRRGGGARLHPVGVCHAVARIETSQYAVGSGKCPGECAGGGMSDTHAVRCSCQETECGGPVSDQVKELFASGSTACVYLVALYLSTAVQLMTRADAIQRLSLHTVCNDCSPLRLRRSAVANTNPNTVPLKTRTAVLCFRQWIHD